MVVLLLNPVMSTEMSRLHSFQPSLLFRFTNLCHKLAPTNHTTNARILHGKPCFEFLHTCIRLILEWQDIHGYLLPVATHPEKNTFMLMDTPSGDGFEAMVALEVHV